MRSAWFRRLGFGLYENVEVLFESISLTNFLSYGPETQKVELKPLNVLLGQNGSGKSNFLEALAFLRAAPVNLVEEVRRGGGVQDYIYTGSARSEDWSTASIEATLKMKGAASLILRAASMEAVDLSSD